MELDLAQTHGWIVDELASGRPVADSMSALIKKCEAGYPHPDWAKLRTLPFADLSPLFDWLQKPFREEPAAAPLRGLWFGLFNPCPGGGAPVADIYVSGSERFEADLDDNTWATGPEWWPESRYASSSLLAEIYRIAHRSGAPRAERKGCLGNVAEYPMCLGYGTFAVRELLARVERSLILGKSDSLGVEVGFDSGDFVLLGELTRDGLRPIDPDATPPEPALEPVLEGLRSSDNNKVFRSMIGLSRFGDRARPAIVALLRIVVSSEEFGLRQTAVSTLAAVAPDDSRARNAVLQTLDDDNPFVRREALQALIKFQSLSTSDLARIQEMENDPDKEVARWSEIALRNIRLRGDVAE